MSGDTGGTPTTTTVRGRTDKLQVLLSEALNIEAQIVGNASPTIGGVDARGPADLTLDVIESTLDALLVQAGDVISLLKQIEQRLG